MTEKKPPTADLDTRFDGTVSLQTVVSELNNPVGMAITSDGSQAYIIEQESGNVRKYSIDNLGQFDYEQTILTVQNLNSWWEGGLLGISLDPSFTSNSYLYLNYISGDKTVVSRYDASTGKLINEIITIDQPNNNHNGGHLAFGPDGYLYIGMGDGGGAGDPDNNGQNPQTLLGAMLRLDVNGDDFPNDPTKNYSIPADNPFVNDNAVLDEIWALGLRNPWSFSFDSITGDLWIGDVGQNAYEEINYQLASSLGGENYGWNNMEGGHCYNSSSCDSTGLELPVAEFSQGVYGYYSIVAGHVYRGNDCNDIAGKLIVADYYSDDLYAINPLALQNSNLGSIGSTVNDGNVSFAEDPLNHDIYMVNLDRGEVNKIIFSSCGDGAAVCDDGFCTGDESFKSCPQDCAPVDICGDGSCDSSESSESCPQDCGDIIACGDGICSSSESYSDCPSDCALQCIHPHWIDGDTACTEEYNPVMGCNGSSYNNECYASREGLTSWTHVSSGQATYLVEAGDTYFNPPDLVINSGDIVRWHNVQGNHDVNFDISKITNESFDNPVSFSLDSVQHNNNDLNAFTLIGEHEFDITGGYNYDCSIGDHAYNGMVGSITVSCPDDIVAGDVNADGQINVLDVIATVNFIVDSASSTAEQFCPADVNGDGVVDVSDVAGIVSMVLSLPEVEPTDLIYIGSPTPTLYAYQSTYLPFKVSGFDPDQMTITEFNLDINYDDHDNPVLQGATFNPSTLFDTVSVQPFLRDGDSDDYELGVIVKSNGNLGVNIPINSFCMEYQLFNSLEPSSELCVDTPGLMMSVKGFDEQYYCENYDNSTYCENDGSCNWNNNNNTCQMNIEKFTVIRDLEPYTTSVEYPNLIVPASVINSSLYVDYLTSSDSGPGGYNVMSDPCLVEEGGISEVGQANGFATVLRFTTEIANYGNENNGDFYIGPENLQNHGFTYSECHNHYHYEDYAYYNISSLNSCSPNNENCISLNSGSTGHKSGWCVIDLGTADPVENVNRVGCNAYHSCGGNSAFGISQGCADYYSSGISVQWIDISEIVQNRSSMEEFGMQCFDEIDSDEFLCEGTFALSVASNISVPLGDYSDYAWVDEGTNPEDLCPGGTSCEVSVSPDIMLSPNVAEYNYEDNGAVVQVKLEVTGDGDGVNDVNIVDKFPLNDFSLYNNILTIPVHTSEGEYKAIPGFYFDGIIAPDSKNFKLSKPLDAAENGQLAYSNSGTVSLPSMHSVNNNSYYYKIKLKNSDLNEDGTNDIYYISNGEYLEFSGGDTFNLTLIGLPSIEILEDQGLQLSFQIKADVVLYSDVGLLNEAMSISDVNLFSIIFDDNSFYEREIEIDVLDVIVGCTNSLFENYNPDAVIDDGSCTNQVLGCIDQFALNYDDLANINDGSCQYCGEGAANVSASLSSHVQFFSTANSFNVKIDSVSRDIDLLRQVGSLCSEMLSAEDCADSQDGKDCSWLELGGAQDVVARNEEEPAHEEQEHGRGTGLCVATPAKDYLIYSSDSEKIYADAQIGGGASIADATYAVFNDDMGLLGNSLKLSGVAITQSELNFMDVSTIETLGLMDFLCQSDEILSVTGVCYPASLVLDVGSDYIYKFNELPENVILPDGSMSEEITLCTPQVTSLTYEYDSISLNNYYSFFIPALNTEKIFYLNDDMTFNSINTSTDLDGFSCEDIDITGMAGFVEDCNGNCISTELRDELLDDNTCQDGSDGGVDLNCESFPLEQQYCGPSCGDGTCDADESFTSCPNDCVDNCSPGYVLDCADDDCCLQSWIGDGLCDGTGQQWGCDLTCYDNDGGDCPDAFI